MERRDAFVAAGFEIIGDGGYRCATVRAICKKAGYTDRYFYALIGSTEALLAAVYTDTGERLKQGLVKAIEESPGTLTSRVESALQVFFHFMRDRRCARILMSEVLGVSDEITALYLRTTGEFAQLLIKSARPFGLEQSKDDDELFAHSLIGAVIYAAGAWAMKGYRQPEDQAVACSASIVVSALKNRIRESSPG